MQKATFAAGCFWGVEATFRQMPGVVGTRVAYLGGSTENPTYKEVCTDRTGHAEAVEVEFDPAKVRYEDLLKVFWENHDPTQLNRQGPDWGTQYRSAIFFHTPEQQTAAQASKESLEKSRRYSKPIVTQIVPAVTFHPAEDYHQQYLEKRGQASCHIKAYRAEIRNQRADVEACAGMKVCADKVRDMEERRFSAALGSGS